jgi:hypothetical protein
MRFTPTSLALLLWSAPAALHVHVHVEANHARLHSPQRPGSIRPRASHPLRSSSSAGSLDPAEGLALAFVVPKGGDQSGPASTKKKKRRRQRSHDEDSAHVGAVSTEDEAAAPKKRRKKSSSKSKTASDGEEEDGTDQIKEAMKRNKDTAAALGDAIRSRADVLRADDRSGQAPPPLHGVDASIASLSLGLGSSDPAAARAKLAAAAAGDGEADDGTARRSSTDRHDGGGVEVASSAVLAHGVQSLLSLLSVLAGLGALSLPPPTVAADGTVPTGTRGWIKLILLRRCLLCALAKHAAGLIAVTTLSARRIPAVGFRETRKRIEALALDPVAQYLFYCALLLVWAPSLTASTGAVAAAAGKKAAKKAAAAAAAATASGIVAAQVPWWFDGKTTSFYSTLCLLGPILLREVVGTAWVVSDVFVILASSGGADGAEPFLLSAARGSADAILNLLFTTSRWKEADAATRQKLLAKLVAKVSLLLEILTGFILAYDGMRALSDYTLSPVGARPTMAAVAKRAMCAYLYFNFLLVRRKKISSLVTTIRGGAAHVPGRLLDIILEPKKEMGFEDDSDDEYRDEDGEGLNGLEKSLGWKDYMSMAFSS